MKNLIIIIMLVLSAGSFQNSSVAEVRALYKTAAEKEDAAEKLMERTENSTGKEPVLLGYKAAAHMLMAKHVGNPFSKMSHFNKGKKIFSSAIEADQQNVELRFLRFSVQSEAPAFLGYRDNLEEDKSVILANLKDLKDEELYKMISGYLLSSEAVSEVEKEKIKK